MAELENSSPHEAQKWILSPNMSSTLTDSSEGNRVGFASQLCLLVDALNTSFEAEFMEDFVSAISVIWIEFVQEVRWCWEQSQTVPLTPAFGSIDLSTCVIYQKLHMLAICIERKRQLNEEFQDSVGSMDHSSPRTEEDGDTERKRSGSAVSSGSAGVPIDTGLCMEESLRFTFKHGRCTVASLSVPEVEGSFNFVAALSYHPELHVNVEVPAVQPVKEKYNHLLVKKEKQDESRTPSEVSPLQEYSQQVGNLRVPKVVHQEFQSPSSFGNTFPSPDSSCLLQVENFKGIGFLSMKRKKTGQR